MLIENEQGDQLLELVECAEAILSTLVPLTHALVAARHLGRNLLVFNRFKQRWELAGGLIDPGESARTCASRELREESGLVCSPEELRFVGAMKFLMQPGKSRPSTRIEYGALYFAEIEKLEGQFVASEEIADVCWWDGKEIIGEVDAIDEKLIWLVQAALME